MLALRDFIKCVNLDLTITWNSRIQNTMYRSEDDRIFCYDMTHLERLLEKCRITHYEGLVNDQSSDGMWTITTSGLKYLILGGSDGFISVFHKDKFVGVIGTDLISINKYPTGKSLFSDYY